MSFFDRLFGMDSEKSNQQSQPQNQAGTQNQAQPQPQDTEHKSPKNEEPKQETPKVEADGKSHIYNLIIVDESGSMGHLTKATLSGVNETINTIRIAQESFKDTQTQYLTLVTFDTRNGDDNVRTLINCQPISNVKDFIEYRPSGCTPLFDAIGQSVVSLHQHIKEDEDATAIVTIVTDGLENASRRYRASQIKLLISQLKEEGWTFSYMGSAHDVESVTRDMNIDNILQFDHDVNGSSASWMRERSAKMSHFSKLSREWREVSCMSADDKMDYKRRMAKNYYSNRVTPEGYTADRLQPNEILVKVGTKADEQESVMVIHIDAEISQTMKDIRTVISEALLHPDNRYMITDIGLENIRLNTEELRVLLNDIIQVENICLPRQLWELSGLKMFDF